MGHRHKIAGEIQGGSTLKEMIFSDVLKGTKQGTGTTEKAQAKPTNGRSDRLNFVPLPNPYLEALTFRTSGCAFGETVLKEVIKVK